MIFLLEVCFRLEHQANFLPYAAHKQSVVDEGEFTNEEAELWLFHGTDAVEDVVEKSFCIQHASMTVTHQRHDFGIYFARDPRMARWFIRS